MTEMSTPMAIQVRHDPAFVDRTRRPWKHVVVLERLARGGGTSRWYFPRNEAGLERVLEQLRGGSCVSFYFDDQLSVELDLEESRRRMFDEVAPLREIFLGYPKDDEEGLDVELVTGSSELSEVLNRHPEGELVTWGHWPNLELASPDVVTIFLVDEDGVLRAYAR